MNIEALFDPASAVIVTGGTLLATLLRSGRAEWRACLLSCLQLGRLAFCSRRARARLAASVSAIQRDGVHRVSPEPIDDLDLSCAIDAMVRHRSLAVLTATHERQRAARLRQRHDALRLLLQAGELAPVFGLAGTLIALTQQTGGAAQGSLTGAVAMAVLTTLYGLILAHLLLFPLARTIERRGEREEAERQRLVDWLSVQLRDAMPRANATVELVSQPMAGQNPRVSPVPAEQDRAA